MDTVLHQTKAFKKVSACGKSGLRDKAIVLLN
jgi:hypothetical protein